jgi:FlaA1/EpsC-like NDP-sugar epimerase
MPQLVSARGSVSLHDLRAIDVEDLLGRDPTPIDVEQVRETLANKVVAVTGAAGSIGAELCRQIVRFGPKRLVLIETDESRLYELWLELGHIAPNVAVMVICDIRDASKLDEVFTSYRPDVVLHAAAYKHVPLMELFPAEAVKTNVLGTLQVIEACERHGVEKFVLISTDKAVEPVNVMGLTKSLAERVMLAAVRRGALNAVAVRFGNVLGSRGSVVPIFEDQLRHGGPITVTDPGVTRYFMTIPEASRLVLQAQAIGAPGDVFVLEMGEPVKIVDLARKMIALSGVPADVEFIGLRPGEKLHEELVTGSEQLVPSEREKILRVNRVDVPGSTFDTDIRELLNAAGEGDRDSLFAAIERLEPGFEQRECGPR